MAAIVDRIEEVRRIIALRKKERDEWPIPVERPSHDGYDILTQDIIFHEKELERLHIEFNQASISK